MKEFDGIKTAVPPADVSKEQLFHFNCADCRGWWSVAGMHLECKGHDKLKEQLTELMLGFPTQWFCPWCGKEQTFQWKGDHWRATPEAQEPCVSRRRKVKAQ
jgi:hypothetical protein